MCYQNYLYDNSYLRIGCLNRVKRRDACFVGVNCSFLDSNMRNQAQIGISPIIKRRKKKLFENKIKNKICQIREGRSPTIDKNSRPIHDEKMDLSPLFNNNKFNKNDTDFYSDYDQLLMNEEKIGSTSPEKLNELKFLNKKTEKKKEKRKKINNKGNKNKKSKKNIKDKKDIIKIKKHTKYDIISMNFGNIDFDSKVNIGNNELKSNKSTKNLSFDKGEKSSSINLENKNNDINNKIIKDENKNEINFCTTIQKKFKKDNAIVSIKKNAYKEFLNEFNDKINNSELKLNEFTSKKVENIKRNINIDLYTKQWKDIILLTSEGNHNIIENIYKDEKNENEAIKLLEMPFEQYYQKYLSNNLKGFLEKDKENQVKDFKQRKYKIIIENLEKENKQEALKTISEFTRFRVLNKKGKKQIKSIDSYDKSKNIPKINKDYSKYSYTIVDDTNFEAFAKTIYGDSLNFELSESEKKNIENNIEKKKELAYKFINWFEVKKGRNRTWNKKAK